ncbi:Syx8 [Drosophila busckii]|uniref:Maker671 n=1 Tax=Drosophila busckii TaxID=30019 RepID=A0A0M3QW60_DROBS|nr:syntaxin-8 [Drosophila busckii]ALC43566.1 maker671 [Drosophila busckii]ALC43583.1 Syx8 [Drosophila busckii]ALC43996.1 Syx8 [Drosophila busckii]
MALVDHDSWDIAYEGCERVCQQMLTQLQQQPQAESATETKSKLERLRKDVSHLNIIIDLGTEFGTETNASTEFKLTQRRQKWEKLAAQLRELDAYYTKTITAASRPNNVDELRQHQAQMLEEQNRGLEVLSATISRQRNLATQLGNEVEDQNNILDNLANNMDRVESGVQRETRSLGHVNRRDSTWGYWLVIILLFVAILIVILL